MPATTSDLRRVPHLLARTALAVALSAALAACGGGGGGDDAIAGIPPGIGGGGNGGGNGGGGGSGGDTPAALPPGLLETTLGNTGQAVDNVAPLDLGKALAGVGEALDPTLAPVVGTVTGLTQQVGAATGLGAPVDGVLTQVGGVVGNLGDTVTGTGLPGGLGAGVGGLVSGLGDTVASVGGLLNANPDNPQPLTTVLGNATSAVGALTG